MRTFLPFTLFAALTLSSCATAHDFFSGKSCQAPTPSEAQHTKHVWMNH